MLVYNLGCNCNRPFDDFINWNTWASNAYRSLCILVFIRLVFGLLIGSGHFVFIGLVSYTTIEGKSVECRWGEGVYDVCRPHTHLSEISLSPSIPASFFNFFSRGTSDTSSAYNACTINCAYACLLARHHMMRLLFFIG